MPSRWPVKNIYYERLSEAKERYRSLAADRGRVYVIHGAPAAISIPDGCKFFQPMELWTYRNLKGFEKDAHFLFYKRRPRGDYVLWQPYSGGVDALYDLFSDEIIATTTSKAAAFDRIFRYNRTPISLIFSTNARQPTRRSRPSNRRTCARSITPRFFQPPAVDPEQVRKIFHSVVMSTAGAIDWRHSRVPHP